MLLLFVIILLAGFSVKVWSCLQRVSILYIGIILLEGMDMNGKWMPLCLAIMLVIGLPRLLYGLRDLTRVGSDITTTLSMETSDEIPMETIRVLTEEGTAVMELEEYLLGVLLCEIPGEFHMEAQKAQAVVARTYAIQTVLHKNKHSENAICTKPECCQGYLNPT